MNDDVPRNPIVPEKSARDRRHPRFEYHTAVTVVSGGPQGFVAVRARSADISAGGAKIVCEEEVNAVPIYLRILIPELADTFVEAEIVNSSIRNVRRGGNGGSQEYIYCTRFRQFVSDKQMLDDLRHAAGIPAAL